MSSTLLWICTHGYKKSSGSPMPDWAAHLLLRDHPYPVGCLAWSLDDSILLTSAEHFIKMWNTKVNTLSNRLTVVHLHQILQTGACIRTLDEHTETVTAISWLPDGTGFITGALDRKVIIWVCLDSFLALCFLCVCPYAETITLVIHIMTRAHFFSRV